MRKLIIIGVLAALLLAGCTAPEAYTASVSDVSTEETIMSETTATTEPTTTTTQETTTATPKIAARVATSSTTEPQTTRTVPPTKTEIALDIPVESAVGNLRFTKATIDEPYNSISLNFVFDDYPRGERPTFKSGNCVDYSGLDLKNTGGGMGSGSPVNGIVWFSGYSSPSDLSTLTLTLQFEGYEPETWQIDIPGL